MNNHAPVREIKVGLNFGTETLAVGRLAMRDRAVYFEYDQAFLAKGLEISPLHLPLASGVTRLDKRLFEGLPGVFYDSLPDGWGRLLVDRFARSRASLPSELTPLDRLAHVGAHGMGALVYEPDHSADKTSGSISLDQLATQAQDVLDGGAGDVLQELLALNGSSAGARPKALIGVDATQQQIIHGAHDLPPGYAPWMVKFAHTHDGSDAGAIEYIYALMAKDAGIDMPDIHLFPAKQGSGYFAVRRFDRDGKQRLHMHTAGGLLHSDFRTPSLDYEDLVALTGRLTRDMREVEKMVQRAVFNVLSHNQDDHAKNFSFLMDPTGAWKLSPAYDLTFSAGPNGEQSTMVMGAGVMGEGVGLATEQLLKLGAAANLSPKPIREMIERTQAALAKWQGLAKEHGIAADTIALISRRMNGRS
jgi:serine/threonine-protein kinase HipA